MICFNKLLLVSNNSGRVISYPGLTVTLLQLRLSVCRKNPSTFKVGVRFAYNLPFPDLTVWDYTEYVVVVDRFLLPCLVFHFAISTMTMQCVFP